MWDIWGGHGHSITSSYLHMIFHETNTSLLPPLPTTLDGDKQAQEVAKRCHACHSWEHQSMVVVPGTP